MPLEEAYPALSEKIRKARAQGYAEPEIQRYLQGKTQEAIRQGYSADEVNKFLGRTGPSFMQRMATGTPGDILAGTLETLRQIGGTPEAPMQAIEAFPEERRKRQETLRPIFGAAAEPLGTAWEAARSGFGAMTGPFIPRVAQESLAPPLAEVGKGVEAGARTVLPPEVAKLAGEVAPDLLMLLGPALLARRPGAVTASPREFIKEAGEGFREDVRVQRLAKLKARRSEALARRQAAEGIKVTPTTEVAPPEGMLRAPSRVQRIEEVGIEPSLKKPHGLYTIPAEFKSPFEDLGGRRYLYETNPNAKILRLENIDIDDPKVVMRRGGIGAGAGVHAVKELLGEAEFSRLKNLTFAEIKNEATKIDPKVDWSKYFDRQEIMEAIGAILARRDGYDAIWAPSQSAPHFSEYIALTEKAFQAKPRVEPAEAGMEKAIRTAESKAAQERMATQRGAIDISLMRTPISRWLDRDLSVRDIGRGTLREKTGGLARETAIAEKRLTQESNRLETRPIKENLAFIDAIEGGRIDQLPLVDQPLARELRQYLDSRKKAVQDLGKGYLDTWIENYFPHIWEQEGNIVQRILGRRPLRGLASFLRERTIPTTAEGIARGLKPPTYNPVKLTLLKGYEMDRFKTAHNIKDQFVKDGSVKYVRFKQRAPEDWLPLDDRTFRALQWSETEKGMIQRGQYFAPPDLAKDFNNYLSPGLKGNPLYDVTRYGTNLLNGIQLGVSAFHGGFINANAYLNDIARAAMLISQGQFRKAATPIGHVLTGNSPVYQFGRGNKLLQEYMEPGRYAEFSRLAEATAIAGGRGKQYSGLLAEQRYGTRAWESFEDSVRRRDPKALAQAVPGVVDAMARPLMNQYVPRMKLGAFADLATDIFDRASRKGWEDTRTRAELQRAWDSVDNRMGQLVYANLFWNNAVKDASHIAVRAVGWTYGTIREIGGGIAVDLPREVLRAATGRGFEVTPRMAYAAIAMPIGQLLFSSLYQWAHTGELPKDLNDYLYPRNGRITPDGNPDRTSLPVYLTSDAMNWVKQPLQTAENKLAPTYHMFKWLALNRDFYGVQIYTPDAPWLQQQEEIAKYMGTQLIPFAVRNMLKALESGAAEVSAMVEPFLGFRPAPREATRSEEENRAMEERIRKMHGIRTQEEAERAKGRMWRPTRPY